VFLVLLCSHARDTQCKRAPQVTTITLLHDRYLVSLQDKEERWLGYAADKKVSLQKETLPMAIQGICRSCLGDVFEGAEEVEGLADCYHKCWREIEVREDDREEGEGIKDACTPTTISSCSAVVIHITSLFPRSVLYMVLQK